MLREPQPRHWQAEYWSYAPLADCGSWWLAGSERVEWLEQANRWLGGSPQLVMSDPRAGCFRAARIVDGRLTAILLVDALPERLPPVDWLASRFALETLSQDQSRTLLAGRGVAQEETGAIICSCFQVGEQQIEKAVANGANSVEALGATLKCGTNCGSCLPELKSLLSQRVREVV